jgi:hypothetical protein
MEDIRRILKQIKEVQIVGSSRGIEPSAPQTEERMEEEERDPVHPILQPNTTFHIIPSMLRMDEIMGQTSLKYLRQIQPMLTCMPSRVLHKLQVSVNHKVQSHTHKDLVELQKATKKWDMLEIVYE